MRAAVPGTDPGWVQDRAVTGRAVGVELLSWVGPPRGAESETSVLVLGFMPPRAGMLAVGAGEGIGVSAELPELVERES